MPPLKLDPEKSVLLVIDVQEALLSSIHDMDRVLKRQSFMVESARLLGVPVVATEQNPSRMGATAPSLGVDHPFAKMSFSVCGCDDAQAAIQGYGRTQAVLIGIETHICVSQTAHDLLREGMSVVVCPDAVSSRSRDRHEIGLERMRDAGVVLAHTESVCYEWLESADHPHFRDALKLVKAAGL